MVQLAPSSNGTTGVLDMGLSFQTIEKEDNRRLAEIRKKQKRSNWLLKVAAKRLGMSYRKLMRLNRDLDKKRSDYIVSLAESPDLSPELRWALAYRIRKSNAIFECGVLEALTRNAGIRNPEHLGIMTTTTEDLLETDEEEKDWVVSPMSPNWEPREGFTGNINVIIDMETSPTMVYHKDFRDGADAGWYSNDVQRMLDYLRETGACRLFNEVDGPTARYMWQGDGWKSYPYFAV